MNKLALVALLALEFAVCGCGTSGSPPAFTNTQATGNWEAQLTGGTDQASLLNFVTTFTVTNQGPLDITGFGFFNAGACFPIGIGTTFAGSSPAEKVAGSANFGTNVATNQVSGTLGLTITSTTNGSVLTLEQQGSSLTGTSNGTTSTTGVLSNGVVVGNWTLTPGSGAVDCNPASGNFILCQDKASCTPTTGAALIEKSK
jgi:hypothetical protein